MRKSVTQLLDDICGADERPRKRARLKLGGLTAEDAWMRDELVLAFDSESEKRRFWAIGGVTGLARHAALGDAAAAIASRLVVIAAADPKFGNRQAALITLALLPAQVDLTLAAIVHSLRADQEVHVRAEAARALGGLGPAAAAAAEALLLALDDNDDGVRWAASIALKFVPVSPDSEDARGLRAAATNHREASVRAQLEVAVRSLDGGVLLA